MTSSGVLESIREMLRLFSKRAWIVLALVCLWKTILLITTAQPIPFSDSFFYDGAVVNLINGGGYCNPSLELVLPISATKLFSAYPPLYQFVLWLWMSGFGTSALAAMWLHLILFGCYALALWRILKHLGVPAVWINFSCIFLFGITFHDRPDSLGFALGFWAIFAWLRALEGPGRSVHSSWCALAVMLNVLTFATSVQLGLLFFGWAGLLVFGMVQLRHLPFPWLPLAALVAIPFLLINYVKIFQPGWWAGFEEHVQETPLLMGLRASNHGDLMVSYLFKLARYVPAVFLAALCIGYLFAQRRLTVQDFYKSPGNILLGGAFLITGGLVIALTVLLIMVAHWILYFQVLIVAITFTLLEQVKISAVNRRWLCISYLLLSLVVGSRSLGMSTWGLANARDVDYATARRQVHAALEACPADATVVVSAAFLYEANLLPGLRAIHSDWLASYRHPADPVLTLLKLKPQKLALTQFDWYRWYEPVFAQLAQRKDWVDITIVNHAKVPPPDASRVLQKLLQHTAWAPVIVEIQWKPTAPQNPQTSPVNPLTR